MSWGSSEKNRWFKLIVAIRCSDRLLEKAAQVSSYGEMFKY